MLDHYYTPRDLPLPADLTAHPLHTPVRMPADFDPSSKPGAGEPRAAVVDLRALDLCQLAFDCDDSDDGSEDGYVSTLLRLQRALPAPPRRIAGARRVARAASAPQPPVQVHMMEVEGGRDVVKGTGTVRDAGKTRDPRVQMRGGKGGRAAQRAPEGEMFQSITAIPGLESTSFEELRLETYLQSLVATGTARPPDAAAPALVIPPAFQPQFCEPGSSSASGGRGGEEDEDVEMGDATTPAPTSETSASTFTPQPQPHPSPHRAATFPLARAWPR
ncbi:hypothetical protein DFH07DRAFT_1068390 [Mycena maculata]|uniref:Uncharacterized protein n=1 Tax=Mycena maculata TaxID=230809 RepID=A0AAD7MGG2_9AGAR|nr:hypothetical protein DFH07DRAFT_1068390 [Mycena maculata]